MMTWIVAGLLAAILAGLELRRPDQRHRAARAALVLVAVAALAALIAPPSISAPGTDSSVVILVTPGTEESQLRAVRDSLPRAPVAHWPDSIPDLGALRRRHPAVNRLVVLGWGMRAIWWEGHEDLVVRRIPAAAPPGFRSLSWPRGIRLGEPATIVGRFVDGSDSATLTLTGPDGRADSLHLSAADSGRFQFRIRPAAVGQARFVVAAPPVVSETLGIAVDPPVAPAVLILEGAPSFETTFLRRWLATQGARVAIRTRLSRDRDRLERLNTDPRALRPLTAELLADFDLLLMDGPALAELGSSERRLLTAAIRSRGLGLLVLPDSLARQDPDFFPFDVVPTADVEERTVRPMWIGRRDRSTTGIPAFPAELRPNPGQTDLVLDPVGRILVATARAGLGRIGTTLLVAPSRWQLEGEATAYGEYWSRLYQALARGGAESWQVVSDGPVVEQVASALVLTTDDPTPVVELTGPDGAVDTIGVAQDLADPSRWWGRFWPRLPGWHRATNRGGAAYQFDVGSLRLSSTEVTARLAATGQRVAFSAAPEPGASTRVRAPMAPLIPFGLLVLSLGTLWAEGRGLWRRGTTHAGT